MIEALIPARYVPPKGRARLLRWAGANVASDVRILHGGLYYGDLSRLIIGPGTFINAGVGLFPTGGLTIGRNVNVGPRAMFMTGSHGIGNSDRRANQPTDFAPVTIGDGTWIGAGAIIQPGVTVGSGCVIAAGAVVTGACPDDTFWAGIPAVHKRDLD